MYLVVKVGLNEAAVVAVAAIDVGAVVVVMGADAGQSPLIPILSQVVTTLLHDLQLQASFAD